MDKVIIAEDDRILLMRLTKALEKDADKFEVLPAKDGQEAIEILQKQPVSVLVTDIQMPRVNGLALLAYVSQKHPNIPCFVMSAYGTAQMKAKLPKDLLQFFQKPFEVEVLAQAIIAVLDRDETLDDLQMISIVNFLHMINMEQASCVFEIRSSGKTSGLLYFENGELCDAECGDLKGEAAALKLIHREKASFGIKFYSDKPVSRQIFTDINQIIYKALT
jgi:CheY-like chemotaxis protein